MQKWEYIRVQVSYRRSAPVVIKINDKHLGKYDLGSRFRLSPPKYPDFDKFINDLGNEGWELVLYNRDVREYLFKRPKPI